MRITELDQILKNAASSTSLDLYKIGSGDVCRLCQALQNNTTITAVSIRNSVIGEHGGRALGELLRTNQTIQSLNLAYSPIGIEGINAFIPALETNNTLINLELKWVKIGIEGAQILSKALEKNTTLESLNLWGNQLGDIGTEKLSIMLASNSSIKYVNLYNNNIGDNGAKALSEALTKNSTINHIDLEKNKITDVGAKDLAKAIQSNANLALVSLNLEKNSITKIGARKLKKAASAKTKPIQLNLNGKPVESTSPVLLRPGEDPNEKFLSEYEADNQEKARGYLDYIDVDYQEGLFLIRAAQKGDVKMLEALLKRRAKAGLSDALGVSAREGDVDSVDLLLSYGADPIRLKGTTAYSNHQDIKVLLDAKIKEIETQTDQISTY